MTESSRRRRNITITALFHPSLFIFVLWIKISESFRFQEHPTRQRQPIRLLVPIPNRSNRVVVSSIRGGGDGGGHEGENVNSEKPGRVASETDPTNRTTAPRRMVSRNEDENENEDEDDESPGSTQNHQNVHNQKKLKTDPNSYQDDDRTLYQLPPRQSCQTYNTDTVDFDIDSLVKTLETDGVVVLPNVYSQSQISAFRKAHKQNLATVRDLMSEEVPMYKPYRHDFDKKRYYLMPHYEIENEETGESHEVIEISPGRLDYTYGMNSDWDEDDVEEDEDEDDDDGFEKTNGNVFASMEFQRPKVLADLMERMLKADYTSYAGALPSAGKSGDGPWHRDVYLLFDDETVDIGLPHGYYFTVLVPLVAVDADNGATEFLKGSHKQTCEEALEQNRSFQACVEPGSVVVFDGRICHRGRRNLTDDNRTVLYMVWTKRWYNDY